MGSFASPPTQTDIDFTDQITDRTLTEDFNAISTDPSKIITLDDLEELGITRDQTELTPEQIKGLEKKSGAVFTNKDGRNTFDVIKGTSPSNALMTGGSVGDAISDHIQFAFDPAGESGFAPEVLDQFKGFLGISAAEAAKEGAALQRQVAEEGIEAQKFNLERARQDLLPFQQLGLNQIPEIGQSLATLQGIEAPNLQNVDRSKQADLAGMIGRVGSEDLLQQGRLGLAQGLLDSQELQGAAFQGGLDPNVLNSPFHQALLQHAQGQVGNSGFNGVVQGEANLLGTDLAQKQLQSRLQDNQQRFAQLQGKMRTGQAGQQLGFGQTQGAFNTALGANQQGFTQGGQAQGLNNQVAQQNFANQLGLQQQGFNQRGDALAAGQNAAAGQARAGQATGQSIADLITGAGNAAAAGGIGAANAQSQGVNNTAGLIGSIFGMFS